MAVPLMRVLQPCLRCARGGLRRSTAVTLVSCPETTSQHQHTRNHTYIVERKYPLPAGPNGGLPNREQLNELHKILLDVAIVEYPDTMKCILTTFVEGVGIRGDLVQVKRDVFHEELYPLGQAVYASPENKELFDEERKAKGIDKAEKRLGVHARMTMAELSHLSLQIPMREQLGWTLTPEHVQVAFRTQGVELDHSCIVLPEEPVTDFGELSLHVWINGLEAVEVKATVVPVSQQFPHVRKK